MGCSVLLCAPGTAVFIYVYTTSVHTHTHLSDLQQSGSSRTQTGRIYKHFHVKTSQLSSCRLQHDWTSFSFFLELLWSPTGTLRKPSHSTLCSTYNMPWWCEGGLCLWTKGFSHTSTPCNVSFLLIANLATNPCCQGESYIRDAC